MMIGRPINPLPNGQGIADAEIATTPSFAEGQTKCPRSSRLM
jgi:hypothetical protein